MPKSRRQPYIEKGSPPSSYAIAAALEKQRGSVGKVIGGTVMRSLAMAPGLALAGLRGQELMKAALLGSGSITMMLFGLYTLRRGGYIKSWRK
jgi:hypothetical protein